MQMADSFHFFIECNIKLYEQSVLLIGSNTTFIADFLEFLLVAWQRHSDQLLHPVRNSAAQHVCHIYTLGFVQINCTCRCWQADLAFLG